MTLTERRLGSDERDIDNSAVYTDSSFASLLRVRVGDVGEAISSTGVQPVIIIPAHSLNSKKYQRTGAPHIGDLPEIVRGLQEITFPDGSPKYPHLQGIDTTAPEFRVKPRRNRGVVYTR